MNTSGAPYLIFRGSTPVSPKVAYLSRFGYIW